MLCHWTICAAKSAGVPLTRTGVEEVEDEPEVVGLPEEVELEEELELELELDELLDVVEDVLDEDELVDVVPPVVCAPVVVPEPVEDGSDELEVLGDEPRPPIVELLADVVGAEAGAEEELCPMDETGSELSSTAVQLPAVELSETSQRPLQSKK